MDLPELDAVIHQSNRLRILTMLYQGRQLAVTTLRDALGLTDGNVASHLGRLEAAGYVKTGRVLVGLAFELQARITFEGSAAFRAYLAALRRYVEASPDAGEASQAGDKLGV
ncbi:MAG TPA: transcriptional regulator [Candidatus Thermoplasmatota archaeon]|nr:transcriptional regulator [Candidatus Thermoplasmatota archaeon]